MQALMTSRLGDCAVLTLNRPDKLNALNTALLDQLERALDEAPAGNPVALILTGAGRAFCAGSDISGEDVHDGSTEDFARSRIARMHALLLRLIDYPVPTIAALNGLAYGGGLELALACTFRTVTPSARLCLPEIAHGLFPSYGGTQLLPRLIGQGHALEMMLTGEPIDAARALEIGLIHSIADDAIAAALTMVNRLPNGAGLAQRMIRRALFGGMSLDLPAALQLEATFAMEVAVSDQARRGGSKFSSRKAER